MLSLDLFDSRYERDLREGAVDDLEARRIDDLNMRMSELLARAREPAYQANPVALAALKKQFQQVKDERDSYYKVREAGIPGNVPVEKIPGKEDLLKGKGRSYYEANQKKNSEPVDEYISMGSDKNFTEAEPYKNYRIYVRKKPFGTTGMYTAHTEIDRKEFMVKGPSQEEAVQAIRDRIDFVLNAQRKVTGSSTIDFNVKFATDLLADPKQTFYAKLENINGEPKLVIASADVASDPELLAAGDFKRSALRNQPDESGRATPLPGIPLTAKGLRSGDWIANGRYTVGKETSDRDRNRVFDLTYHSTAHTKSDKLRLNQPAFTLGTTREDARDSGKIPAQGMTETVTDPRAGMARIYRRLAPKIERHRDSFLAGQLYDELENYAELHGAEGEFKRMMNGARNRAHMEYDTNPGGFQNWFWFLPFADEDVAEGADDVKKRMSKLEALALAANRAGDDAKCKMYQQKIQSLKQKLSQIMSEGLGDSPVAGAITRRIMTQHLDLLKQYGPELVGAAVDDVADYVGDVDEIGSSDVSGWIAQVERMLRENPPEAFAEGWSDQGNPTAYSVYIDGREWRAYKSDEHARAVAEKVQANLKRQGRDQTVTIAPSKNKHVQESISRQPKTARERDEMIDKIQRMMSQERNPANLQIMRKDIEMLRARYRDLKEDSAGGEAVEIAVIRRILVAHTDLIMKFGLDRVVAAIEEVAYDVGDVDEFGSSDVSGWVRQVERMLEPDNEV